MFDEKISTTFLSGAAHVLAETDAGLSGNNIAKVMTAYAIKYEVDIPHPTYPFEAPNKRTAFLENISRFSSSQQYTIIKELCDHKSFALKDRTQRDDLKMSLISKYQHLAPKDEAGVVNATLIEQTRHWLDGFPAALALYNDAMKKYDAGLFSRNVLDDLRLSLEKLLREIGVDKSLEHQLAFVGGFIKEKGGSKELGNMFVKLLDYYGKYQNEYVKHDAAVIEEEIEFVIEITSSFMKHLVRLSEKAAPPHTSKPSGSGLFGS